MSANLNAFLFMVRWAEGTSGPDGYRTLVGGELFNDFSDHPRKIKSITFGNTSLNSSAAGAYQFLQATWDRCKAALNLADFSPENQDRAAIYLIGQRGALPDIEQGDLRKALEKCSWEWASLPPSRYNQPTKSYDALEVVYERAGGEVSRADGRTAVGGHKPQPTADSPGSIVDKVRNVMSPLLIPAISAVVDAIPSLVKLFGSGSKVAERNVKAVSVVADVIKTVTNESSVGAAAEKVLASPDFQAEVEKTVQARWYELSEVGGGIETARQSDKEFRKSGDSVWRSPSFIVATLLIPLIYIGMVSMAFQLPFIPDWPFEIRVAVISNVVGMVLGGVVGYYFGMMTSRNRATAAATEK